MAFLDKKSFEPGERAGAVFGGLALTLAIVVVGGLGLAGLSDGVNNISNNLDKLSDPSEAVKLIAPTIVPAIFTLSAAAATPLAIGLFLEAALKRRFVS